MCPWAHQFIFPCLCPHLRNGANNVSWPTCNTSTNWGPWKELPKQESSFLRERDGCGRKRWKGERLWSFHLTLLGPVQRQIWYKFPRLCALPTKGGAGAESCLLKLDSLSPWKSQWLVLMTKLLTSVCFWYFFFPFALDISSRFSLWVVNTANTS